MNESDYIKMTNEELVIELNRLHNQRIIIQYVRGTFIAIITYFILSI